MEWSERARTPELQIIDPGSGPGSWWFCFAPFWREAIVGWAGRITALRAALRAAACGGVLSRRCRSSRTRFSSCRPGSLGDPRPRRGSDCMAGPAGFEPAHGGIKTRCLTAWLRPNISLNSIVLPDRRRARLTPRIGKADSGRQDDGATRHPYGPSPSATVGRGFAARVEPAHGGIKTRCLTAWLRPNISLNSNCTAWPAPCPVHPTDRRCRSGPAG